MDIMMTIFDQNYVTHMYSVELNLNFPRMTPDKCTEPIKL